MLDIEIATYWNVETLYYVLNAVASIMGGNGFSGLLKMVFYFAVVIGIFAYAGNKQLEMATWFIQALIFTTVLNLPIARVAITDRAALEPPRVVDNVPVALAVIGQTANTAFGWLTRTYESAFGVPDDLGLQRGDLAFGHRILQNVNRVVIRDPGLRADLMQYFKECTLYDIRDGTVNATDLVGQTGSWEKLWVTNPARFVTYDTLTAAPQTKPCSDVATVLKGRVDSGLAAAMDYYGRANFSRVQSDAIAGQMYASAIGTSYDWILSASSSSSDAMKQAMFNNIWRDAGSELPALLNDPARIGELQSLAGAAQAARQSDASKSTIAMLAQETLPHMRNWIEAMLYALFPIVVIMVVLTSTEGAKKLIGGYMMSICWIGIWPVMFAVINHLSLQHLKAKLAALKLAQGVPFQMADVFDATIVDEQAAIGYMVILVPMLSGALIKMAQGGFMGVADRMITGFSGAANSVGASMAMGNQSMGQVGMDTAAVNTTSMNKYNSSVGLVGGGSSIEAANGNIGRTSLNGRLAVDDFRNNSLASATIAHRRESGSSQDGSVADTRSSGNQASFRSSISTDSIQDRGRGDSNTITNDISTSATTGESGAYNQSNDGSLTLNRNTGETSNFTVDSKGSLVLGAGAGTGGGGGDGGGPSGGGGGRSGGGGGRFPLRLGGDVQKTYSAGMGRAWTYNQQTGETERATAGFTHSETGERKVSDAEAVGSRIEHRDGNSAHLKDGRERTDVEDDSRRNDTTFRDAGFSNRSNSLNVDRNLYADPDFLASVAQSNNMSAHRFANLPEPSQRAMVEQHLAGMSAVRQASSMPSTSGSGRQLPTSPQAATGGSPLGSGLPSRNDVANDYPRRVRQAGYVPVSAVPTVTSSPPIVDQARSRTEQAMSNLQVKTEPIKEAVKENASPDRPVGGGRLSESGVALEAAKADGKDAATSLVGRVKNLFR